jgi:uncharacterized OsmC-like protein
MKLSTVVSWKDGMAFDVAVDDHVPLRGFSVDVEGDTADEHPMRFDKVRVAYRIGGDDLPLSKVRRAIALTEEKYCGVWATLAPAVTLESTLFVNGEEVPPGED